MEKNIKRASEKSLVKKDSWEKEFVSDNKTEIWDDSIYANKKLQFLLKKYLPKGKKYKILEAGCYPGSKLIFFKKNFDYSIYGVEFIKRACIKTRENLKKFNVNGTIIHSDFFDKSFLNKYKLKFDVIFDFGFCEHFKDFNEVIEEYSKLLRKNGYLVIIMPNLRGIYRLFSSKELLKAHNIRIMNLKTIKKTTSKYFEKLFCGYVGGVYSDCAKESNIKTFVKNKYLKNFLIFVFIRLNKIMNYVPIIESKIFSPYLVYIGKKQ